MQAKTSGLHAIHLLLCGFVMSCMVIFWPVSLQGQKSGKQAKSSGKGRKAAGNAVAKRFEVERAVNLRLIGCTGDLDFPGIRFSGKSLEIDGDKISLVSGEGSSFTGSVIAYSRSAYFMDANVGLTFNKANVPVNSPDWHPPTTISLVLLQNRKKPKQFSLVPVPGTSSIPSPATISCTEARATVDTAGAN